MSVSNFEANRILNFNFGKTAYTPPVSYYLGASTTAINKDGTGETEPTDPVYKRVLITNSKVAFGVSANSTITNTVAVEFPESTVSWGTITHMFLSDALTGGNILYFDIMTPPRQVTSGTTMLFPIGSIVIKMTDAPIA